MKYFKILLTLLMFFYFSSAGICASLSSQGQYSMKLNLQDTSSVADKANKNPSLLAPGNGISDDPFVNSAINGMGNMIQGLTNGSYSGAEQQRQQMDYARQQMEWQ